MKYVIQIFSILLPFILFMMAHNAPNGVITMEGVNLVAKKINILAFLAVGIVGLFGYAYLVGKEVKESRRLCYTLAQLVCLLTSINAFAYGWVTNKWIDIVAGMPQTAHEAAMIDIFYSIVDFSAAINKFLVIQFIFVTLYKKWILPLRLGGVPMARPIGEILIEQGIVTQDDIDAALKRQEHEAKGDGK